ncbi:unnamed protein product [Larinioides sclopetarius]|uniref:Uncharacterized protein n=1 Tax=Larinioides sclopetarius TaxID=280406 RepID=A0AAV1Z7P7_9ARAC
MHKNSLPPRFSPLATIDRLKQCVVRIIDSAGELRHAGYWSRTTTVSPIAKDASAPIYLLGISQVFHTV